MAAAVTTDEIYKRYLDKAIAEILRLEREVAEASQGAPVAQPTGHPLGTIFLLKYGPQASELQEGVAFHGRAGHALKRSLERLKVDPLRGLRHELRQVRGRRARTACRAWLKRELRIVQPRLLVVMGEDSLRFLNEHRVPALAAPRPLRWASSSDSRRRSRRWSSRTSTSHSTSSPRRHDFGTRSSPSAPGGPSSRPTSAHRGARRLVRARPTPGCARNLAERLLVAVVLMPAAFSATLLALPLSSDRRLLALAFGVALALLAALSAARGARRREPGQVRGHDHRVGWLFLTIFEALSWVVVGGARSSPSSTPTRSGAARPRRSRRSHPNVFSSLSVAFVVPGGGAARLGLPDVMFFALFLAASLPLRAARADATWAGMLVGARANDDPDDRLADERAAGAAGDLARLPAPERRPDLARVARGQAVGRRRRPPEADARSSDTDSTCGVCGNMSSGRVRTSR